MLGSSFLDLFGGSGSVGLEAASRGATSIYFVEDSASALSILRDNVQSLGLEVSGDCFVVKGSLPRLPALILKSAPFDLVFADPPYAFTEYPRLLEAVSLILADSGRVAIEHSSRTALPTESASLRRSDQRNYGESILSFFERK